MKKALILPVFLLMTFRAISQIPCIVPGNPGTVDLPAPCPYSIVPGIEFTSNLPPGSTLLLSGFLNGFACTHPVCPFPGICEIPGGILGGTMVCYSCNLNLTVMGTGVFAGYMRTLVIPGIMSYHTAPRTTGLPVQEFQCEMMMLLFEVVGDPDFSLLRIASGLEMQLPGSGTTALTKMPDGQWWVESFFDVFTEVTINGNPQGPLGNVAGSGVYPSRLWQGIPAPKGACCLQVSKSCITTSQVDCFYRNGVYYGDNSSCDTVNCGPLTDSFHIVMNPQGSPLIAGGSGQYEDTNYNIGGWYLYPNTGWWNIWYYDHPLDTSRFKRIDISFYVAPMDPNLPGWIEVAANWSTPLWSLQGDTSVSRRPPVPGIPGMNETLHIGRHTLFAFQGFIQPGFQQLCFYVENYNPEWVSVDVRGENFQLEQGQIVHECIHGQLPPIGRCCYLDNNNVWQCADNFECECSALNGSWNDTLNCTANPCPVPVDSGACCLPNKQCVNASQTSCLAAGGVFKGVGSSCDTVNCGPITNTFYITRGNNPQPGIPPLNAGGTGQFDNGAGFNGWYWYETYDWWNIWYYDHPYDTSRWKMVTISFDVWVFNPQFPFDLDFALNWSMPAWSLQGITTPPLPPIPPSMEDMIIGRHIFPTVNLDPTIGMQHFDLCYIFPDFNPEWVSVDVRGYNFEILNGVITHECIFDTLPHKGRCCYPDATGMIQCADIYQCECAMLGGTWDVSLNCTANPCPQPQGACCMPDGSCVQTDINTCGQILHGMWMGVGVPCVPNPCPQPEPDSGACCYPDGSCMYRDSISCIQTGGTYQGDGVSCMPNPCPQPQGACCMPDGSCVQTDINTCGQILHGMWMGVGIPCVPNPCTAMPDTIIGVVIYGNTARTPMRGVSVILSKGVLNIDTAVTDTSGVFRFLAWPGSYHLKAFYHGTWPHGAANANDALLVMKHFVGLDTVYGIHWLAGDVNASHNLSTTDAMQIAQRFVGMIPSFAAGDWAFLEYDITVGGSPKSSTSVTMEGLVYGDANASYTFGMKKETGPGLVKDNPLQVKPMESVMIPVRVSQAASIASASLSIRYASHSFDIVTVNSESNQGSLVFKTSDGILRIAWYDIEESNLEKGDVLFWITATVKPLRLRSLTELYWEILPESELTGFNGKALDVDLMIPDLQLMPSGLTVGQNRPNPFTKMTDIDFFISEPGMVLFEVMNPLGQHIAVLAHGQMEAGRHEVSFDCRNCPPGVYFYRVLFTGTTEREVITRRMILQ